MSVRNPASAGFRSIVRSRMHWATIRPGGCVPMCSESWSRIQSGYRARNSHGSCSGLIAGDLEVPGRAGEIVHIGPLGQVVLVGGTDGDGDLDADRRGEERGQPARLGPPR